MNAEAVFEIDTIEMTPNLDALRAAVADHYSESVARIDVRHLWTAGRVSFVRVNWWSERDGVAVITRSAFVRVEATGDRWCVRDVTARSAA